MSANAIEFYATVAEHNDGKSQSDYLDAVADAENYCQRRLP